MFVVTKEKLFTRTVKLQVPTNTGHEEQSIRVTFRLVNEGELSQDGQSGHEFQKQDCRKIIVSIDDLIDEEKGPVEYTEDLRDQLIEAAYIRLPILNAYIKAVTKVKAGN